MRDASRLVFIDWLRAIAISLVVVRHVLDRIIAPPGSQATELVGFILQAIAGFGWIGVHLFFIISGFLVGGYVVKSIASDQFDLWNFVSARALRILPAAYAVIVIVGILFFNDGYLLPGLVKNFLFVQTYTSGGFMSHYWSLCVEMHFYAVLPFVAYAMRRISVTTGTAVAVICGFALLRAGLPYLIGGYLMKPTETHWLPDFFAVGILLAMRPVKLPAIIRHPVTAIAAYIGAAVTLAVLADPVANVTKSNWGLGLLLALIVSTLIFVSVQAAPLHRLGVVNVPVRWLATLSYSIYLVHLPIIEYSGLPPLPAVAASLIAALALHSLIERPFLTLKQSLRQKVAIA